jgi:hypothetical protein
MVLADKVKASAFILCICILFRRQVGRAKLQLSWHVMKYGYEFRVQGNAYNKEVQDTNKKREKASNSTREEVGINGGRKMRKTSTAQEHHLAKMADPPGAGREVGF